MTEECATHSFQRNAKTLKTKQRAHSTPLNSASIRFTSLYFTPSHITSLHFTLLTFHVMHSPLLFFFCFHRYPCYDYFTRSSLVTSVTSFHLPFAICLSVKKTKHCESRHVTHATQDSYPHRDNTHHASHTRQHAPDANAKTRRTTNERNKQTTRKFPG